MLSFHTINVRAATTTTTFAVTATVLTVCGVVATPLVFGNYNPSDTNDLDAANIATVTCTVGTSYNLGLDAGTGAGATVTTRKLTSGTDLLNYSLYQDPARTNIWGNTIGTNTLSATAGLVPTVHNVYGRIFKEQVIPAGIYTDTITVTITY
ncbi:spore coat U domain-containing protein [Nitrosomonas sp. PY1]|uniref:Csu type fimbrial protein n=1 Tax=Nitrosomonas sp. PY1 TaxID=1803906 RepID=UPI001FC7C674|nr:spore coat U domain-containing protein [Nitrosomonas sp. PY1]